MNYYNKEINDVLSELETLETGLDNEEVLIRQSKYGLNELPKKKQDSVLKIFISQFQNPIEIILVVTVILSLIIGEYLDAFALIFIIMVDVLMGTFEDWRALKDANALIEMIKSTSRVWREGSEYEIESKNIVIGDILLLESGDKVPADARIIECHNFQVNESSLTGESVNVYKNIDTIKGDVALAERKNMVYAGTVVTTGRAKAVVVAIALDTEIGHIADKVTNTEDEKSPLTIRIERFSKQISVLIVIIALITTAVLFSKGTYSGAEILLCVVALAVSAMPEGLPLALTMALTIASKRMIKQNVIVKKLNAVESLGSCTVIASDKTGTLTVNEQTAKKIILATGEKFDIEGSGYNDVGQVKSLNGADLDKAKYIAMLGAINNEAHLEYKDGKWESFGDSIDIAFLALAAKLNITNKPSIIERIPYESEQQYSAVFYQEGDELFCTVKGSLEKVMSFSDKKAIYNQYNEELTGLGYRVIAIASGKVKEAKVEAIKNLEFLGMVAFIDPIRKEVKNSINECRNAGIKVVMVTGDHPLTAYAIAKDLGLCKEIAEVATGEDIAKYKKKGHTAFDEYISKIRVFSRVTPLDKLDIVESFKRQGEFVAVTGDGVNDAPAIKSANIGIAMGSGTDVAKETASMIITNDNFTSIVAGIKEGRTAYSNIRKITLFLLGCGFAEVCFFLLSIAFGFDIPLLAIQLLWLNLVTDGLQDIALSFEQAEDNIMNEAPRDTKESLFSKDLMLEVGLLGLTISLIVFITWYYLMKNGTDIVLARSIIMLLMVFIQNVNVLNCRSEKRTVFKESLLDNPLIIMTVVGSIILQIIVTEVPIMAKFLGVIPLEFSIIAKIFGLSLIVIVVYEIYKLLYRVVKKL